MLLSGACVLHHRKRRRLLRRQTQNAKRSLNCSDVCQEDCTIKVLHMLRKLRREGGGRASKQWQRAADTIHDEPPPQIDGLLPRIGALDESADDEG